MHYIVKCARCTSLLKIKYESSKKCLASDIRRPALVFPAEERHESCWLRGRGPVEQHFWAAVSHEFGQQTLGLLGCEKGAVEGLSTGHAQGHSRFPELSIPVREL